MVCSKFLIIFTFWMISPLFYNLFFSTIIQGFQLLDVSEIFKNMS